MTLNTHSLSESDEKNKLQTIANFILNHDVDVICLQEVNQSITAKSVHKRLFNSNTFYVVTLLNEDKIFFEKNRIERFLIEK